MHSRWDNTKRRAGGLEGREKHEFSAGWRAAEMTTIRFTGWISGRIMSLQPDTDIQKLLSNGNRIRISETLLSIFRGFRLWPMPSLPAALSGGCEVLRKKLSSQISKNKVVFFTANQRDSIFPKYKRRRLKTKPLQCKTLIKIKEIRSEYLAHKHEKSEFSNKF